MKKPTLCCCFTWIVLTELNFTVAFLLKRKTWDDWLAGKVGGGGWGDLRNGGDDFKMKEGLISRCGLCKLACFVNNEGTS